MNNNTPHEGEMELAKRIADKLFTSGFGDKARRLVLELETDSHGCGWSKRPVIDLIARELAASRQPPLPDAEQKLKPKVVCLCGSTRFTGEMLHIRWHLEKQGIITLSWNYVPGDGESHLAEKEGEDVKLAIDELHKRKIDLSDEVFVINLNGYIGESTRAEIAYAESIGVPVNYLERQL